MRRIIFGPAACELTITSSIGLGPSLSDTARPGSLRDPTSRKRASAPTGYAETRHRALFSRLGMNHDVDDVGDLQAQLLLELAGQQVSIGERFAGRHSERDEHDAAGVGGEQLHPV